MFGGMGGGDGSGGITNANKESRQVVQGPTDSISEISWLPTQQPTNLHHLVAGSWDSSVRIWQVDQNLNSQLLKEYKHDGPVLSVCCSSEAVFSGGCDKTVRMWTQAMPNPQPIGQHDAPVKCMKYADGTGPLVTGSWDKTLRYWDPRTTQRVGAVNCPERVYCLDLKNQLLVVGFAERLVHVYDLRNFSSPMKSITSPLRYQTRCVAIFTDMTGYALGSIEGRVAIQHVNQHDESKNFAFKCHREGQNNNEVYSVNSIAFHNYGTFATAGSNGNFNFWDKDSKQRLKQFGKCNLPIVSSQFNSQGNIYAYAVSYDWSKGAAHHSPASAVFLHPANDNDIKQKNRIQRR